MKILIAGKKQQTKNYESALRGLRVDFHVSLTDTEKGYDGLLLPGGGDIHPSFWGESAPVGYVSDMQTDSLQFKILEMFIQAKKPVLGICKGMQLINVYFGGTLIKDLPNAAEHKQDEADVVHMTRALKTSFMYNLYGEHFCTNSAHHQGIFKLGENLSAIQYSNDGVIEGIMHNTLPVIGTQWHPERMCFAHKRNDTVDGESIISYALYNGSS